MKTIALYGLQMLVGLVALAAGYAKLTGMGFMAEPFAMIGLGKTFLMRRRRVPKSSPGLCLLFPRSGVVGARAAGDRDGRHDGREPRPRDQPPRRRDQLTVSQTFRTAVAGRRDGSPGRDQKEPGLGHLRPGFQLSNTRIFANRRLEPPVLHLAAFPCAPPLGAAI